MDIQKYLDELDSFENHVVALSAASTSFIFRAARMLLYKNASLVLIGKTNLQLTKVKTLLLEEFPYARIDLLVWNRESFQQSKEFVASLFGYHPKLSSIVLYTGSKTYSQNEFDENGYHKGLLIHGIIPSYFLFLSENQLKKKEHFKIVTVFNSHIEAIPSMSILKNHPLNSKKQLSYGKSILSSYTYYQSLNREHPHIDYVFLNPGAVRHDSNFEHTNKTDSSHRPVFNKEDIPSLGILFALSKEVNNSSCVLSKLRLLKPAFPTIVPQHEIIIKESGIIYEVIMKIVKERQDVKR